MLRREFESPALTAADIFGARPVSPTIRSESEIRMPSVSAYANAGHAVKSLVLRAHHSNAVSATVTSAPRTDRSVTYDICSY